MNDGIGTSGSRLLLGRYRLGEVLGGGASASVWRALDEATDQEVALKVVHEHLVDDDASLARLRREAATASLRHQGMVGLVADHLHSARPALAFEIVEGETLARRLGRDGRLGPALAADILAQVADVLVYVHDRGLVHRDVKPSNVLVGRDGRARLLDFGLSAPAGLPVPGEAGTAVGTMPYLAPEQLAGQLPQPACDVYSLGAVLYQALSGAMPFEADEPYELARAQLSPPTTLPGGAQELSELALAALAHSAAERPTMTDLAGELRAYARSGTDRQAGESPG